MKKSKAKKIPSSKAELRKWLKKTRQKYLVGYSCPIGSVWFACFDYLPTCTIWAMPLADIAKSKRSKKR